MIIGDSPQLNGVQISDHIPCIAGLDARWNRQLGIVVTYSSATHNGKYSQCIRDDVLQREPQVTRQLWLCIARKTTDARNGKEKGRSEESCVSHYPQDHLRRGFEPKRVDKLSAGCSSHVSRLLSRPENNTRRTSLSTIQALEEQ